jgi:hypothetical protein
MRSAVGTGISAEAIKRLGEVGPLQDAAALIAATEQQARSWAANFIIYVIYAGARRRLAPREQYPNDQAN